MTKIGTRRRIHTVTSSLSTTLSTASPYLSPLIQLKRGPTIIIIIIIIIKGGGNVRYCHRPVRARTKLSLASGLLPRFRRPDLRSDISRWMGVKWVGAVRYVRYPRGHVGFREISWALIHIRYLTLSRPRGTGQGNPSPCSTNRCQVSNAFQKADPEHLIIHSLIAQVTPSDRRCNDRVHYYSLHRLWKV
jgi:hypothetical protein